MRRAKSQSNMNTVVGLVAAILVVNVLIFFVVTRDKGESKQESEVAVAPRQTQQRQVGSAAAGGTAPSLDMTADSAGKELTIEPEETVQAAEEEASEEEVVEDAETVEAASESYTTKRIDSRTRNRKKRNDRSDNTRKVTKEVVVPEAPTKVEPQKARTNITTVPSGATISLDGIFIGKSPIIGLEITSGNHSVAVSYSGYKPQVSRLKIGQSGLEKLRIRLEKNDVVALPKAVTASVAPALVVKTAKRAPRTPRVGKSTMGSESRGRSVLGGTCNSCHTREGAKRVGTKRYTSSQWSRFFASGTHDRYQRLGGKIGTGQLADVKAYVMSKAADAARNQGAGIR